MGFRDFGGYGSIKQRVLEDFVTTLWKLRLMTSADHSDLTYWLMWGQM